MWGRGRRWPHTGAAASPVTTVPPPGSQQSWVGVYYVTLRCKNVCIPRPYQLVVDGAGELVGGARLIVAGLHPEPGVRQELHDVGAVDPLTRRDRVTPLGEILARIRQKNIFYLASRKTI